jgi:hypothetical protein
MSEPPKRDLFVLVADLDAQNAVSALLMRHKSIRIRPIAFDADQDMLRYSGRDSGCCAKAVEILRGVLRTHQHSLVFFDKEGCGRDLESRKIIEDDIEERLFHSGWDERAKVIVFDPELEAWVWAQSHHVATELGWSTLQNLHDFLHADKWLPDADDTKPLRPKEALEAALLKAQQSYSARRFRSLAEKVGRLDQCGDPSFAKFLATLRAWFRAGPDQSQ